MTAENQWSKKTFFETYLSEERTGHPIKVLGDLFMEENGKDVADLSYIRFAQGEVYFHNKDYEAAIFKWEHISNELEPWAKKNVGDAYYELGLLQTAIDTYKSIQTDNLVLQTEIALQLFSIFIETDKQELAIKYIKKAVSLNPDYENVTGIAKRFFEEREDWANAIELAIEEGIRTGSIEWFDTLIGYIEKGYSQAIHPDYFSNSLLVLYQLDEERFEKLVSALWRDYENEKRFIPWIKCINEVMKKLDGKDHRIWNELTQLYCDSYLEAISGKYKLKELKTFMPGLLENWVSIVQSSKALSAYAAVLSWNELFPSSIDQEILMKAEREIWDCKNNPHIKEDSLALFNTLIKWAEHHHLSIGPKLQWFADEVLNFSTHSILLVGVSGSGKSTFINTVLGEELFDAPTLRVIRLSDGEEQRVKQISEFGAYIEEQPMDLYQYINYEIHQHKSTVSDVVIPNGFLKKHRISLIDTPGFKGRRDHREDVYEYLALADSVLFVLDADEPFTTQERELLLQMKELAPNMPIHFVITKLDTIYNKQEVKRIVDDAYTRILEIVPDAKVLSISSKYENIHQKQEISKFFSSITSRINLSDERTEKLLFIIRKTIHDLLEKLVQMEEGFKETINWNEQMLIKLDEAIHQVDHLRKEKIRVLQNRFYSRKEEIAVDLRKNIPQLLKDCSSLIHEDSNFKTLHLELNEEMNRRIQRYVQDSILPRFYRLLQEWLADSKEELIQSKGTLDEMAESFNLLYGEEKLKLECDFRILDDWSRDINRMTAGIQMERENILLRFTPSQFLLKSAGKLFSAIPQNKNILYNQYKKFIATEDYEETTNSVTSKLLLQFELFEKAIERDILLFFSGPNNELKALVEEAHLAIQDHQQQLDDMSINREQYQEQLSLFELRLRQYEWMIGATKEIKNQPLVYLED